MIAMLARQWNAQNGPLWVEALSVNGNSAAPLPPDHAGRLETTLLAAYQPQTVDMSLLPPANPNEAGEVPFGPQRHDPAHSLHGIFGADPRDFNPAEAADLRRTMAAWLANYVGDLTATNR